MRWRDVPSKIRSAVIWHLRSGTTDPALDDIPSSDFDEAAKAAIRELYRAAKRKPLPAPGARRWR